MVRRGSHTSAEYGSEIKKHVHSIRLAKCSAIFSSLTEVEAFTLALSGFKLNGVIPSPWKE